MKIFATHDDTGCGWYRVVLPLRQLAAHGHEVHLTPGRDAKFSRMMSYPLIVGQRVDKREALSPWRQLRMRSKLVYEIDDDVFSVDRMNWQAYEVYSRAATRDVVAHAAEVSNLVTVTNSYLGEVMAVHNPAVAVLPNFIPDMVLNLPAPAGERPAVGWAGGASHGKDVQLIARPVREFLGRHKDWDAILFGTDYRPTIAHHRCGFIPWVDIQKDPEGYYRSLDFDIGLAPLAPDGVFNRSKSPIKALEYAARGIPVIASDAEPYRDFVLHGVTGYLVKYDHEWLKYLDELADPDRRAEMGAKAKEHARGFTIEENWRMWEEAYEAL